MAMSSSAILQSIPNYLEQARRRNVLPVVAIVARTRLKTKGASAWGQRRKSDASVAAMEIVSPGFAKELRRARFTLRFSGVAAPRVARRAKRGAQGRDRTTDTAIFSRMLYQL